MSSTESRDKLERIRQAREGDDASTDGPEVFTCPVEGCTRTVIGNLTALRSHVQQSNDDGHQYRVLNDDLEIEIDEEAYHSQWHSGYATDSESTETTVNSAAAVNW